MSAIDGVLKCQPDWEYEQKGSNAAGGEKGAIIG